MTRTATEKAGLRTVRSASALSRRVAGVNFYALEGSLCVLIEADSAEDARYLCREMRLEFVALCER